MTPGAVQTKPPRMPKVPTLTLHKRTGQGYVRMNGRCYYLGRYGEPETEARYHQKVVEWMARGRQLPVAQEVATVVEVCSRFWRHAESYYLRPDGAASNELHHFKQAMKPLKMLYGMTPAVEFGPLALRVLREKMIAGGWCRRHVNHNVGWIKRVFRWATGTSCSPATSTTPWPR